MNRRNFTKACITCMAGGIVSPLVTSCQPTKYISGTMDENGITVLQSDFTYFKKEQRMIRQYLIVRNDALDFPIYVYRFNENEYAALFMKCTHQGAELQASGDHLHCPGHGSEFNNKGVVAQGPAEENLRTFKVTVDNEKIIIDLRA